MNKNMLKYALVALGGTGLGAAIGSFFTYKKVSRKCKEQYENEISIIKNDFAKKLHNLNEEVKHEKTVSEYLERKIYESSEDVQLKATVSKIVDEYFSKEAEDEIEEYEDIDEPIEDEEIEDETEEFVDEDEQWTNKPPKHEENMIQLHSVNLSSTNNAPYVLSSPSEFGELEGYSLSSLTYYAVNDLLVDEQNEPLEYPAFIIGAEAMETLKTTNLLAIYVRDDVGRVDYEVMIDPDTDFYES